MPTLNKKQRFSFSLPERNARDPDALNSLDKKQKHWTYGVVQTLLRNFWTGTLKDTPNPVNNSKPLIHQLIVFLGNRIHEKKK